MASVERRADRGNRWEVRYRDPEGKQRARLFDLRADAEQFLTGTEHSKLAGTYIDPALGRVTFGEFVADEYRPTMVGLENPAREFTTSPTVQPHGRPVVAPGHRPGGRLPHARPGRGACRRHGRGRDPVPRPHLAARPGLASATCSRSGGPTSTRSGAA